MLIGIVYGSRVIDADMINNDERSSWSASARAHGERAVKRARSSGQSMVQRSAHEFIFLQFFTKWRWVAR